MSEAEPRRSVRSTKGQHKALDQLEQPVEPKRRGRKGKKATPDEKHEEDGDNQEDNDIIRCICGVTQQDENDERAWIACDECGVWQHNVCMGISVYKEDIPDKYYCEQCRPDDHKELLEGIAKGEKPWEARWKAHEEQEKARKKKRGSKKGKKRQSDQPEESQSSQKSKASPAPEKKEAPAKGAAAGTKRKARDESQDKDSKATEKLRKVSSARATPAPAPYEPPGDLPDNISDLPSQRQGPAKLLTKSLVHALDSVEKRGSYSPSDGVSNESRAERLAIAIERAVQDTHATQKEYAAQIRTLGFNLKNNLDLCTGLLEHSLTPPALAVMKTEELASKELQKETAALKAKAEKQSILVTEDGPRLRRTHKGDEVVADYNYSAANDESPMPLRRFSARDDHAHEEEEEGEAGPSSQPDGDHAEGEEVELPADIDNQSSAGEPMEVDTKAAAKSNSEFDIKKVFSSVKSPTGPAPQPRRLSAPVPPNGPGVDPDVDRLLEDDGPESPPYSPTMESSSDIIWRGNVTMKTLVDFPATAQYIGGADFSALFSQPWTALLPESLVVAGRITEDSANTYLCSLRYSSTREITILSLMPTNDTAMDEFIQVVSYFATKKRYGVVGDKGFGNVRDTYLVPVLEKGATPEFLLNLEDEIVPETRDSHMLLLVIVSEREDQAAGTQDPASALAAPPNEAPSPSPAGQLPPPQPQPQYQSPAPTAAQAPHQPPVQVAPQTHPAGAHPLPQPNSHAAAQAAGEAMARQILGPLVGAPVMSFLLPQAYQMTQREWELVRDLLEREPRARDDLQYLSTRVAEKAATRDQQQHKQQQPAPRAHHATNMVPPAPGHPGPSVASPSPVLSGPARSLVAGASGNNQHVFSRTPVPLPVPAGMPPSIAHAHQAAQAQQAMMAQYQQNTQYQPQQGQQPGHPGHPGPQHQQHR